MASHINLLGSIVIGALLLLAILNMNSTMTAKSYEHTLDNMVRGSTTTTAEMISHDFHKIGFGVTNPANMISSFDSTSIQFLGDLDADGIMDTLTYTLSDIAAASNTPNPRDRYIYRQVNNGPQVDIGLGVTDFKLRYFDATGYVTTNPGDIDCIEIQLTVESIISCIVNDSTYYARNYWQTRISPPNLLR